MTNKCRQGAPYEELSTVKVVGNKVLLCHTITTSEDVVCKNSNWRMKTFDSFRKKGFRPVWWRVLENRMGKKRRFDSNRGSSTRSDSVIINKLKC